MTADLTPEALDALAALDQAATPGPWRAASGSVETIVMSETVATMRLDDADAALIAAMRNALPALIAAAREASHD